MRFVYGDHGLVNLAFVERITSSKNTCRLLDRDGECIDSISPSTYDKILAGEIVPNFNNQISVIQFWRESETGVYGSDEYPIVAWRVGDIDAEPVCPWDIGDSGWCIKIPGDRYIFPFEIVATGYAEALKIFKEQHEADEKRLERSRAEALAIPTNPE